MDLARSEALVGQLEKSPGRVPLYHGELETLDHHAHGEAIRCHMCCSSTGPGWPWNLSEAGHGLTDEPDDEGHHRHQQQSRLLGVSGADTDGNSVVETTDEATGERFILRANDLHTVAVREGHSTWLLFLQFDR